MRSDVCLELADASATEALGELLGRRLRPGDGLALTGDLGAGKTCVARGVGRGLGLDDPDGVQSPTYLLVMEHPGPVPMLHVDAYLAEKTRAFLADGGLDYLLSSPAVVVVEWADRLRDLLPERILWVHLRPLLRGRQTGREAILSESPESPAGFRQFPWVTELPEILARA
ncbi:MAG: tRNA (adenosine(37)-N6)-threonylcarbamoyltransferase complex ATPase subunit type 1 TsaE [Planctomycetota bacterium]|jgi:tRNA threonylcarbamoyladenosine biosynthesis protein TsaE